jgi:hypothetical protein
VYLVIVKLIKIHARLHASSMAGTGRIRIFNTCFKEWSIIPHTRHTVMDQICIRFVGKITIYFSKEATNTNFIVLGLTRPGFEPMIYRTRGEHANHYTTDAVDLL